MKHIIIAGSSRSGKTTLSMMLAKKGFVHYKMDSIKRGLDNNFCKRIKDDWKKTSPKMSHLIKTIITENESDQTKDKEYYVIDTCHIYPSDIYKENIENTIIIFLLYPNLDIDEKIKAIRKYNAENIWTNKYSDAENINNLEYGIAYSKKALSEAIKYNIKYYDTSKNFEKVIKRAYKEIIGEVYEENIKKV